MCFPPYFGYWVPGGGGMFPKALVHNLLMRFFAMGNSRTEVSALFFLITQVM